MIPQPQMDQFERDGFLVVEQLISSEMVGLILDRAVAMSEGRVEIDPHILFIREPSIDPGNDGSVRSTSTTLAQLRKIWPLSCDAFFVDVAKHNQIVDVVTSLRGPDIKLFMADMMLKPALLGSAKPYHQDSPYFDIKPMDLICCWIALAEATSENGAMCVVPGAHRLGVLPHVKDDQDHLSIPPDHLDTSTEITVQMRPGDGLFFHSLLPHRTGPNLSMHDRPALILRYMDAHSLRTREPEPGRFTPPYIQITGRSFAGCV